MSFQLPQLPYKFDALEPYFNAKIMEIHYTNHHQAYIDNLNKALVFWLSFENSKIEII